jgi:hypothetical protein
VSTTATPVAVLLDVTATTTTSERHPMNTIATVKTLTAEVRVLMVGNRQVTLSVYRQLDEVEPDELEPFGRVNDSKDRGLSVVGRSQTTGELVRANPVDASVNPYIWGFDMPVGALQVGRAHWDALPENYDADRKTVVHVGHITVDDRRVRFYLGPDHPLHEDPACNFIADGRWGEVESLAREVLSARAKAAVAYKSLADLPLIVLAGLR